MTAETRRAVLYGDVIPNPVDAGDVVPKSYVDSVLAGGGVTDGVYGDITISGGVTVFTIGASKVTTAKLNAKAVTYSKIQDVTGTDKVLGRATSGAGAVEEIDCTAAGRDMIAAADVAAQRTLLGLVIGTNVQAYDVDLAALAGLTSAANKLPYFTGSGSAALADLSAAGRALIDDADAAAQRTTLGLGTMATQAASAVAITGGSVAGITDLAIADGGHGASTAAGARANLGLADGALEIIIDGGGAAITTGVKLDVVVPFACTITSATLLADQSGSAVVNIWKDTYANFPPTVADKITASAPPTLSAAAKSQDATLAGWTTALAKGDILRINVDSASTVERLTLSLAVTR